MDLGEINGFSVVVWLILFGIGTFNVIISIQLYGMYREIYQRYCKLQEELKKCRKKRKIANSDM